jgi:two-component system cell cycle sensor histidine kinase/response regulator CckA
LDFEGLYAEGGIGRLVFSLDHGGEGMGEILSRDRFEEMASVIRKAAGGDFSGRIGLSGVDDDPGGLAVAINRLLDHVSVMDRARDAIFWLAGDGKLVYVNEAACRSLGYTREELLSMTIFDIDPRFPRELWPEHWRRARGLGSYVIETLHKAKDGRTFPVEVAINCMHFEGGEYHCAYARDITERKREEKILQKFRFSMEQAPDAVFWMNREGRFEYVNDRACRSLGYSRDELLGLYLWDIDPFYPKERLVAEWAEYRKGGDVSILRLETWHRRKDGALFPVEVSAKHSWFGDTEFHVAFVRDITERKAAGEAVRRLNRRNEEALRVARMGHWEFDVATGMFLFNDQYYTLHGITAEEAGGYQMTAEGFAARLVHPDDAHQVRDTIQTVLESGNPDFEPQLEARILRGDGEARWVTVWCRGEKDGQGRTIRLYGVSQDITGRKAAEEALMEKEGRLKEAQAIAHIGNYEIDLSEQRIWASEEALRIYGVDPTNDPLMLDLAQQCVLPEFRPALDAALRELILGTKAYDQEFQIRRICDGEVRVLRSKAERVLGETGRPVKVVGVVQDITDQKRAEEEIKSLARFPDENPNPVMRISRHGSLLYANPSSGLLVEAWDCGPGRPLPETWRRHVLEVLASGEGREVETRCGESVYSLIFAPFAEAGYVNVYGQDITKRKAAEEARSNLEIQLVQAQKMESVGRLAGGVAHDFNNMLTVILGYSELIKARLDEGNPLLALVSEIERAAGRSRDLTRQLLAFSRKQIIAPRPVDLNDLVMATKKTLTRLIGEDIDLHFHPKRDLWKIMFDPSQIDQILVNLAVNARDAMPDGGKLTIETANVLIDEAYCRGHLAITPGQYALLAMSDNGIGMNREIQSHIFEPFFTTKEVGKGTGLGLATVYGIVKQNGGFIYVYSEPGRGTTFKIYIPRIMEEGEPTENPEEIPIATGSGTILVVEDDKLVERVTTTMLEAMGYLVRVAESPRDALQMWESGKVPVDLLITDVVMPGMSGTQLRERFDAIRPGVKVLFMSGYTTDVIVHHGVLAEGVDFIQKPFNMKDLANKVREMIGKK